MLQPQPDRFISSNLISELWLSGLNISLLRIQVLEECPHVSVPMQQPHRSVELFYSRQHVGIQ